MRNSHPIKAIRGRWRRLARETAMRRRLAILGSALVMALLSVNAAQAQVVTNEIFPVSQSLFVPCANGGAGEEVAISGNIHEKAQFTIQGDHISGMLFANALNFSGVGQVTGDVYRWTAVSKSSFSQTIESGVPFSTTSVFSSNLVGRGPGNNLVVDFRFHTTINANGDLTVHFETTRGDCK